MVEIRAFYQWFVVIGILLLSVLAVSVNAFAQDFEDLKRGVVKIEATTFEGTRKIGTGFIVQVGPDAAYIATASHVVEGATSLEVEFFTQRNAPVPAQVIGMEGGDPQGVAVLLVRANIPPGLAALPFDNSLPGAGEAVTAIGFPRIFQVPWAVIQGNVVGQTGKSIAFSGAVDEGNSGGPLLKNGAVVGVVTEISDKMAYAVPTLIVQLVLKGWGVEVDAAVASAATPLPAEVATSIPAPQPTATPTLSPAATPTASPALQSMLVPGREHHDPISGIDFVWIPEGCFLMGSPDIEEGRDLDEGPVHEVCLNGFWMGKTELTQAQWQRIMGSNPSFLQDDSYPVDQVSWHDAQGFLRELNALAGGEIYRLPTEAEWEYAARAGTSTMFSFGDNLNELGTYAWYAGNSEEHTHPVGQFLPNAWGLYDMHGNAWEWCQDWYDDYSDSTHPQENPQGPDSGEYKVLRGGAWDYDALYCRSANRYEIKPELRNIDVGFRVVVGADAWTSASASSTTASTARPTAASASGREYHDLVSGIDFVWVPEGCFQMGQSDVEKRYLIEMWGEENYAIYAPGELPQHEVCVDGFWMGNTEVTQAQWQQIMGNNPSHFVKEQTGYDTSNHPVEKVSWHAVQEFLAALQKKSGDVHYRLPTEAEWEYAARAGTTTMFSFGDNVDALGDYAWQTDNSEYTTHAAGQLKPNNWGLYDMHGNVWEWCGDWYYDAYYAKSLLENPQGPESGESRVMRGGAWSQKPYACRSALRGALNPEYGIDDLGFRVVVDGSTWTQ